MTTDDGVRISMSSLLSQLRRKPERVRRHIVLFGSVGATVVIALFWLASFAAQLAEEDEERTDGFARSGPFRELGAAVTLFTKESASAIHELKTLISAIGADEDDSGGK